MRSVRVAGWWGRVDRAAGGGVGWGDVATVVNAIIERIKGVQRFLDEREMARREGEGTSLAHRMAHFWILVGKSFQRNRGPTRAAALTYTTLLALVPILAVVVSVSTSMLKSDQGAIVAKLVDYVVGTVAPQLDLSPSGSATASAQNRKEVVDQIMGYINKVNSGALGVTAMVALVFIAITVLSSVEGTFNDMWGVSQGRPWLARIVQYWATITLGPIFLVTAVAVTGGAQFARVKEWLDVLPGLQLLLKLVPFLCLCIFLTLFYKIMPATPVAWKAAMAGGLAGGVLLQLNNLLNVMYISKVVTYSKIYGGLGAVPIFLIGIYFSWLIVLLGSQVSYAFQNKQAYLRAKEAELIHQRGREFVALRLITEIAARFFAGEPPPGQIELVNKLGVPAQLAAPILTALVKAGLLLEVGGESCAYAPGRPIDRIAVEDVLTALRTGGGTDFATAEDPFRTIVRDEYARVTEAELHAASAVTLQTLVVRAHNLPPKAAGPLKDG